MKTNRSIKENMVNYENSIIYKLCCKNLEVPEIYIGSTTCFKARKRQHKSNCNNEKRNSYNIKIYKFIRETGGFENWDMIQIKAVSCNSKRELEAEERLCIEEFKPSLNCSIPTRTVKEYYSDNADKLQEYQKQYYIDNTDKKNAQDKQYRIDNKEKLKQYRIDNKEKIKATKKQYQIDNKEKFKQYRIDNKDTIKEYQKLYRLKKKFEKLEKQKLEKQELPE